MADTATSTQTPKAAPNVDEMLDQQLGGPGDQTQAPPAPTWRDAVLDGDDVPENFRGKKAGDLFTSWQNGQEAVRRFQSERDRAAAELQHTKTQLTARQAAEQAVREMFKPQEQQREDPRYAQLNDLMFSDPAAFNRLRQELDDERLTKMLGEREAKIRREVQQEAETQRNKDIGRWAFEQARLSLHGNGVTDDMFSRQRIAALYTAITLPSTPDQPNPYYDEGGPLNPGVIFKAWGDLFGYPKQQNAPPQQQQAAPPPVQVAAPPGGGRPSPAPTPPPARADNGKPMSAELRAVMESFAEEMGKPKDQLIKRSRGVA